MNETLLRRKNPKLTASVGACDCHIHVFGPSDRFPVAADIDYRPAEATVADYLQMRRRLGISRTVVVQPSIYGTDNSCTLEALADLGDSARGIAVVTPEVTDDELEGLHAAGIRGLRFSQVVKNAMRPGWLEAMAPRIRNLGWHVQLRSTYRDIADLEPLLQRLAVDVCIDHMSSIPPAQGIDHPAIKAMLRLIDTGYCWVKLSAPYQLSETGAPDYVDFRPQARILVEAAPERMVWGTNWPHPTVTDKPDEADLLDVLLDWADDDNTRQAILVDNPAKLYGFAD